MSTIMQADRRLGESWSPFRPITCAWHAYCPTCAWREQSRNSRKSQIHYRSRSVTPL